MLWCGFAREYGVGNVAQSSMETETCGRQKPRKEKWVLCSETFRPHTTKEEIMKFVIGMIMALSFSLNMFCATSSNEKKDALENIMQCKNSCKYAELFEYLQELDNDNTRNTLYKILLLHFSYQKGDWRMVEKMKSALSEQCRHMCQHSEEHEVIRDLCIQCKKRNELNHLMFLFYHDHDFSNVAASEWEEEYGPSYQEILILSSIIENNLAKLSLCNHQSHHTYDCLLAKKHLGKKDPIQTQSKNTLTQIALKYYNGELDATQFLEKVNRCLADLPALKKILRHVVNHIENK